MAEEREKKLLEKLQNDLGYFLISETIKSDPAKVNSPEVFKYKGLHMTPNEESDSLDKTVKIQIGGLEAEYKVNSSEKISGGFSKEEEKLVALWMKKKENNFDLRSIFERERLKRRATIIPFDLEEPFNRGIL